jgi:SAM-dependent methyltransferase
VSCFEDVGTGYDGWADYYDLTDTDHSACISFYRGLITPQTKSLLDLGCGTGANTVAIAAAMAAQGSGRIVGVDTSARMLRHAGSRNPAATWIQGDLRSATVTGKFDVVVCCFNVLQLIPAMDLLQVFSAVASHMHAEGVFGFDLYQPNLAYLQHPPHNRLAKSVTSADGRTLETREDGEYEANQRLLRLHWRLVDAAQPHEPLARLSLNVFQHSPEDVEASLTQAGLEMIARYGDFDRSPFLPASRKQVVVCRRAALAEC